MNSRNHCSAGTGIPKNLSILRILPAIMKTAVVINLLAVSCVVASGKDTITVPPEITRSNPQSLVLEWD